MLHGFSKSLYLGLVAQFKGNLAKTKSTTFRTTLTNKKVTQVTKQTDDKQQTSIYEKLMHIVV